MSILQVIANTRLSHTIMVKNRSNLKVIVIIPIMINTQVYIMDLYCIYQAY